MNINQEQLCLPFKAEPDVPAEQQLLFDVPEMSARKTELREKIAGIRDKLAAVQEEIDQIVDSTNDYAVVDRLPVLHQTQSALREILNCLEAQAA